MTSADPKSLSVSTESEQPKTPEAGVVEQTTVDAPTAETSNSGPAKKITIGSQRDVAAKITAPTRPKAIELAESNPVKLFGDAEPEIETAAPPIIRSTWGLEGDDEAELAAALGETSMEDLLAKTEVADVELEPDSRVKGIVNRVTDENVFFLLKGRFEGVIATRQFKEPPVEGAMIDVVVKSENTEDGLWELSLPGASVDGGDWDSLQKGDIVDAHVTGTNTGGLEVTVNSLRGFIPASQIDRVRVETFGDYANKKLQCLVQEINPKRRKLVLSRRAILDREFEEKRKEIMGTIEVGQILEGLVTRLADFGAFVDVGGLEGLIHISKLSWSRIKHPSEVLEVGQKVKAKVDRIDAATGKVSLSFRDTIEHPWEGIDERFPVNSVATGRVTRIATFGAFVQLGHGIEGLVHISELAHHRVFAVKNVVKEGDEVQVKVLSIDRDQQKIGLSLKATQAAPEKKSDKKEVDETDLPARPLAVSKRSEPLQGGRSRASGGDKFGLNL